MDEARRTAPGLDLGDLAPALGMTHDTPPVERAPTWRDGSDDSLPPENEEV